MVKCLIVIKRMEGITMSEVEALFKQTIQASDLSAKQQAVLQASLDLFAAQGFDRTTSSEIAARAGVSEGTVYKKFKTKKGIFDALMTPFLDAIVPRVTTEFAAEVQAQTFADFAAFLQYLIANRMQFVLANHQEIKIFAQEIISEPTVMTTLATHWQQLLAGPLGTQLDAYKAQQQLIDWPNARIAQYIGSTIAGYMAPQILLPNAAPVDVAVQSQAATEFLLRGLASET